MNRKANKKAALSQGEPRNAAVNFHSYRMDEFYNGIVKFLCHSTAFL